MLISSDYFSTTPYKFLLLDWSPKRWTISQSVQLANFNGNARAGAIALSLGNYGYVGLGSDGSTYYSDFWKYNPTDDSWTQLADFPGEGRGSAVAFAINEDIYVGLGSIYAGGFTYYSDFYKYSPSQDTWTAIESYGGGLRSSAVSFVIDNFAYVGTGSSPDGDKNDFWKYNPNDNTWVQVVDAPDAKHSASGFTIKGKGYLVAGITYVPYTTVFSDVQEYCPVENTWTERIFADGMNLTFTDAATFVLNNIAYIAYGNKDFVTTYNPQTNMVVNKGDLIGIETSRYQPCSFVINGIAYFGLGSVGSTYYNDIWEYTPPLPEPEVLTLTGGGSYCEGAVPSGVSAYIESSQTQISYQLKKGGNNFGDPLEGNGGTISWENLEAGSYTAVASNGTVEVTMSGTVTVGVITYVDATIGIVTDELSICQGQSAMITANVTNEGNSPSFKWLVNNVAQGGTSQTLVYEPSNNDVVTCELTSDLLCVNINPITSNELEFSVQELVDVSIEISAESLEVCLGDEITIVAETINEGETPSFIWTVNSQNQNQNSSTFTYIPANGDKVICNLIPDIACPSETMAISNELEIVVNECTSVEVDYQKHFSVYPNPVQSKLTIEMHEGERIRATKVLSLDGKVLLKFDYSSLNFTESIDLSHLAKGIYILQVEGEKVITSVRVVKE